MSQRDTVSRATHEKLRAELTAAQEKLRRLRISARATDEYVAGLKNDLAERDARIADLEARLLEVERAERRAGRVRSAAPAKDAEPERRASVPSSPGEVARVARRVEELLAVGPREVGELSEVLGTDSTYLPDALSHLRLSNRVVRAGRTYVAQPQLFAGFV